MRPKISVIGKPTANRFSVGAARLITPNARFTTSNAVMPGSATINAPANSWLPHAAIFHIARPSKPGHPDRQRRESLREHFDQHQMAVEREKRQRDQQHVQLPSTGVLAPRNGSTLNAKPKPIEFDSNWPPIASASKISCNAKPMATPMMI